MRRRLIYIYFALEAIVVGTTIHGLSKRILKDEVTVVLHTNIVDDLRFSMLLDVLLQS